MRKWLRFQFNAIITLSLVPESLSPNMHMPCKFSRANYTLEPYNRRLYPEVSTWMPKGQSRGVKVDNSKCSEHDCTILGPLVVDLTRGVQYGRWRSNVCDARPDSKFRVLFSRMNIVTGESEFSVTRKTARHRWWIVLIAHGDRTEHQRTAQHD